MRKLLFFLLPAFIFNLFAYGQKEDRASYLDKDGVPIPTHSYVNDFSGKMLDTNQIRILNE